MLNQKIERLIELSNQIKAIFNSVDLAFDNSTNLELAAQLLEQRDREIREIFVLKNQQQLANHQILVNNFLQCDKELQQVSSALKSQMSKKIVQQKRKTKATQAYIKK